MISKHLSCRQLKNDELVLLSVVFKSSVLHLPLRVKILTAPELVQNQSDFVLRADPTFLQNNCSKTELIFQILSELQWSFSPFSELVLKIAALL